MGYIDLLSGARFRLEREPVVICDCRRQGQESGGPSAALTGIRVILRRDGTGLVGTCRVCGTEYRMSPNCEIRPGAAREALDIVAGR